LTSQNDLELITNSEQQNVGQNNEIMQNLSEMPLMEFTADSAEMSKREMSKMTCGDQQEILKFKESNISTKSDWKTNPPTDLKKALRSAQVILKDVDENDRLVETFRDAKHRHLYKTPYSTHVRINNLYMVKWCSPTRGRHGR